MRTYVIRRSFVIPLGLLVLASLALLVVCLVQRQPPAKSIILGLLLVPTLILFMESACRKVLLNPDELVAVRLLRRKALRLSEITAVETVTLRRRVFFTLCAGDEFVILSNSYADFPDLVKSVLERVPTTAVSDETQTMAANPPTKTGDIISAWVASILVILMLLGQLGAPS